MPTIKILDPVTVTKIAAGEVIDRPSSIVKELIENSLDAGATKITVSIESGGKKQILITDNGSGILPDDMPLAPARHATSKLTSIHDIYTLDSFGFRGEALASICHVARVTLTSRHKHQEIGYQLHAYQDHISTPIPIAHGQGTTIDVQDLFFELPVRKKFLKSSASESAQIYDIILHMALLNPTVSFVLISDGKERYNTTGISDQKTRILQAFGKNIGSQLVEINTDMSPLSVTGYIGNPTLTYPNRAKQLVSINGRIVKSPVIQQAIYQSFRDIIPHRRFPLVVLNLAILKDTVDINIHPQKQDVKFHNPGILFDTLPKIIQANLHTKLTMIPMPESFTQESPYTPTSTFAYAHTQSSPDLVKSTQALYSPELFTPKDYAVTTDYFQVLDTYIVLKARDSLWLLDQHAVHERILYEKIKTSFETHIERQPLLLSEIITLPPDLYDICQSELPLLLELGFDIEDFGQNRIVIREIPSVFSNTPLQVWLENYLYQAKEIPGSRRDLTLDQKETLQMKACKAAIKAGKRMSDIEIQHLLKDLQQAPANYTCPHGRPLFIRLKKNDLEKLFLRS